ncbi:serine/threonine-protein kinase [Archangium gephyra]|uniref:Serine/threonine kinase n=1 Tax=Archangium gephyra TaxID=48 RepID=A0AAC8Q901_9BACT|nr:serine/threonine-protein kinase [Archangium gephyra]AKJ02768.1 Serine/threonine kinase [Archangium gephyra]REG23313.1 serine/threonine-protein kinase [Archangium gephyra]
MTTEALHPDHLEVGDTVGPWHIVQVLGRGGSSRVFKVERDGRPYSMKMALLPLTQSKEELSEEAYVEEESAYRRLAREAAALFTYASHPNLLAVYAVDFWPNPTRGYAFIVTDFVDGEDWHRWRWSKHPHAARLVEAFSSVVRTVGVLHARGVYHRDLKAENILIRRQDGRPFLIDFGTVRLPGALTKTLGLPEGVLHLLPPELLAYTRTEAWKRGEPFHGGVAADLYALGVLLYQGLTDLHPFNPELPDKELVGAISTLPPVAPHLLNPLAPRSLSDIAMRLLEKKPEDRYPNTDAVLQALDEASEEERASPAWKVPLTVPEESPAAAPLEQQPITEHPEAAIEQAQPQETPPGEKARPTSRSSRRKWLLIALACILLVGAIGLLIGRALLEPSSATPGASATAQRGTPPMPDSTRPVAAPRRSSLSNILAAWLCAATGVGCPGAQVRPEPANCPADATEAMFKELKMREGSFTNALIDVNQPAEGGDYGIYADGPIVGRVTDGEGLLVEGTLLYGRLWTGPGLTDDLGREAVIGRYTRAVLPDGREYPVCIALGGPHGRMRRQPGPKSGTVLLVRTGPINGVWRWP